MIRCRFLFLCVLVFAAVTCTPCIGGTSACFDCHEEDKFKGNFIHSPVAAGECTTCHSPHVARYGALLLKSEGDLCFSCHSEVQNRKILHTPVREGRCSECHSPHASSNSGLLPQEGGDLCFNCHEETLRSFDYSHHPFAQGQCSGCHQPHGGEDFHLLKMNGTQLCLKCHEGTDRLRKSHLGRNLADVDCLSCHHPHGSKNRQMLRAVSHEPFAKNQCSSCHSRERVSTSCLDCHEEILPSFNHVHSHLGIAGEGNGCTACHNPHVGDKNGLLPANTGTVCRKCHEETFKNRERMLHKHPGWNSCADCHDLHGADEPGMLKGGLDICAGCHERHAEFSHPMGDNAPDPRDGRPMTCQTCHNANEGTMYKHFLRGSGERGLCIKCHQRY